MDKYVKPYKLFITLILSSVVLFQTFPKSMFIIDYYLHTEDYAAYCINKDKPEMHCDGMCQVDKKLNEIDHRQKEQPNQQKKGQTTVVYLPVTLLYPIILIPETQQFGFPPSKAFFPNTHPTSIFHPPQIVAEHLFYNV